MLNSLSPPSNSSYPQVTLVTTCPHSYYRMPVRSWQSDLILRRFAAETPVLSKGSLPFRINGKHYQNLLSTVQASGFCATFVDQTCQKGSVDDNQEMYCLSLIFALLVGSSPYRYSHCEACARPNSSRLLEI